MTFFNGTCCMRLQRIAGGKKRIMTEVEVCGFNDVPPGITRQRKDNSRSFISKPKTQESMDDIFRDCSSLNEKPHRFMYLNA